MNVVTPWPTIMFCCHQYLRQLQAALNKLTRFIMKKVMCSNKPVAFDIKIIDDGCNEMLVIKQELLHVGATTLSMTTVSKTTQHNILQKIITLKLSTKPWCSLATDNSASLGRDETG
jgi:hypothetical protein